MTQRAARRIASAMLGLSALALSPSTAAARAHGAGGRVLQRLALDHYFITAFAEEAAMLDAGTVVKGWARTGVDVQRLARRRRRSCGRAGVPLLRHARRRVPTRTSTPPTPPSARWSRPTRTGPTRPSRSTSQVPQGGACQAGTEAVYRSFHPGADVSESNHRFLPDLTMHQKMAGVSTLEGVVMCAPLSTAQRQADAVRLLEQPTFGATDALVAHVTAVGIDAFLDEQFAASGSRYSSNKYVPAGGAATFCPTDPNPVLLPRLLLAVPAPDRLLPQCARQRRPAAPARRVRAVADLRDLGPRHQRGLRRWRATSRSSSTTRSATTKR